MSPVKQIKVKDIVALDEVLLDTIQNIRAGEMDFKTANSISAAAQRFINSQKLQLLYAHMKGIKPTLKALE